MGNQIVFNAETAETALNNTGLIGLSNNSEVETMSSLEIAELTGKRHDNVMVDIEKMLSDVGKAAPDFAGTAFYEVNNAKRSRKIYNLPKRETLILVSGYSVAMRARIIDRWQELEEANKNKGIFMPNFSDPEKLLLHGQMRSDSHKC